MSEFLILIVMIGSGTVGAIGLGFFFAWLEGRPLFKKGDKLVKEEREHWEPEDFLTVLEVGKLKYLVEDKANNKRSIHKEDLECEYERFKG